jgi:hypothetical protein
MAKIVIGVAKGFSGQVVKFEADGDMKIRDLIKILVEKFYYDVTRVNDYALFNLNRGFEYRDEDTLSSRDTKNGEIILLIESSAHGSVFCR